MNWEKIILAAGYGVCALWIVINLIASLANAGAFK